MNEHTYYGLGKWPICSSRASLEQVMAVVLTATWGLSHGPRSDSEGDSVHEFLCSVQLSSRLASCNFQSVTNNSAPPRFNKSSRTKQIDASCALSLQSLSLQSLS